MTKANTLEFAKTAFATYGKGFEKVLSAAESGALYWNVIYHFQDFKALLREFAG